MRTATDVALDALDKLGIQPLPLSLEDDSRPARACRRTLPQVRRYLLESGHFAFSLRRRQIAPDAEAPAFGWARSFTLPADFIAIEELTSDTGGAVKYELEGRKVLADVDFINLRYVADIMEYAEYPPAVYATLVHMLAVQVGLSLGSKPSRLNPIEQKAEQLLGEAMFSSAIQKPRLTQKNYKLPDYERFSSGPSDYIPMPNEFYEE